MHMADALLSPAVGGTLWAVSGGLLARASRRLKKRADNALVPLMGVLGAFIFSAQMINFTIPLTGSSGHIGGGIILAALLGSDAALIVITSVLAVQALFFADGGLLALGCNIFNMGIIPCYIAYPLVYRTITNKSNNLTVASIAACVVSLQLGAFSVVAETTLSGISELPFLSFLLLMLPIHLVIGIVEGIVTAGVIGMVRQAKPELTAPSPMPSLPGRVATVSFAVATLITAGFICRFASTKPDGLEWSVAKASGRTTLPQPETTPHTALRDWQRATVFMPDYGPKTTNDNPPSASVINSQTSLAGIIGSGITMALVMAIGILTHRNLKSGPDGIS